MIFPSGKTVKLLHVSQLKTWFIINLMKLKKKIIHGLISSKFSHIHFSKSKQQKISSGKIQIDMIKVEQYISHVGWPWNLLHKSQFSKHSMIKHQHNLIYF